MTLKEYVLKFSDTGRRRGANMSFFVKVKAIKETKMMELDPSRWYPVIELFRNRIKVAGPTPGFTFQNKFRPYRYWEFPKKWVKAAKEE